LAWSRALRLAARRSTKSICRLIILLHIIIRHNLTFALIQIKLAVDFLLPGAKLPQAFFMLKGTVKLLPVIGKRFFHMLTSGFLFLSVSVKAAERIFNQGNRSPYYQSPFNCWEHFLVFLETRKLH
jgi:hypothetical protein